MAVRKTPNKAKLKRVQEKAADARAALDAFDEIVEAYLKANGDRLDCFGVMAANRTDLVHQMRKGRDFRRSTMRRVFAYMENSGS
jgi:hypothetical protein